MLFVKREDIDNELYQEIFKKETHHNHAILDDGFRLRWEEDKRVNELIDKMGLNYLIELFYRLGIDKNNEIYRKLYRDMGYSLEGYWEIFYWEVNNPEAHNYKK